MRNLEQVSDILYLRIKHAHFLFNLMIIKPSFQGGLGNR